MYNVFKTVVTHFRQASGGSPGDQASAAAAGVDVKSKAGATTPAALQAMADSVASKLLSDLRSTRATKALTYLKDNIRYASTASADGSSSSGSGGGGKDSGSSSGRLNVLLEGVMRMPRDRDREYYVQLTPTELLYTRGTKPSAKPHPHQDKNVIRLDLADCTVVDTNPAETARAVAAEQEEKNAAAQQRRMLQQLQSQQPQKPSLNAKPLSVSDLPAIPNGGDIKTAALVTPPTGGGVGVAGSTAKPVSLSSFLSKHPHQIAIHTSKESFNLAVPSIDVKRRWLHFLHRTVTRLRMITGKVNFAAQIPSVL